MFLIFNQENLSLISLSYKVFLRNGFLEDKWRPPSLSELTPIIFNMELTHLGTEASKWN